ncbi:MAG: excinuclease ABC subunit B [Candidatus Paceibacteria bacterium]|jgi:excinuclease ABC subunit B
MAKFVLKSEYSPAGDQPEAIKSLVAGLKKGLKKQTLLGVTGSGKTYTVANVIEETQKPTLVIAHNKTLAAQLAQEFKEFFPDNAVHYFVSYYDYYQPEAYVPVTDTYIEKDASINKEIDRLRHASTQSLLTRKDVIIVASVSCIYGLGSPKEYEKRFIFFNKDQQIKRIELFKKLVEMQYERTSADLEPGKFRAVGNTVEIMPISAKIMYRVELVGNRVVSLQVIDPVTSIINDEPDSLFIAPAKHFMTNESQRGSAIKSIKAELKIHLKKLEKEGKILEAERLKRRTNYDLAMINEVGYCSGIENYSRHLSGKNPGDAPDTLLEYFPHDENGNPEFLTIIDESHVTLPQLRAMHAGDQARKENLVEFGFRLPSAKDNRPLQYKEFEERVSEILYVSATPGDVEREEKIVQQIIRPTGLIDPEIVVRPIIAEKAGYIGQVQDFIAESEKEIAKGGRVIATTLTKKMAEDLSEYLKERKIKAEYLHSDIKTIERIQIITEFRKGNFDILVGVNLLREGLDMPEVTLIGILDADKEGFLRSETSLIQTIGRAARNVEGRVILYADRITGSMERAMGETARRRDIQLAYNKKHGITPKTIIKSIKDITEALQSDHEKAVNLELQTELSKIEDLTGKKRETGLNKLIKRKEKDMEKAVAELDFETAAILRDELRVLREM